MSERVLPHETLSFVLGQVKFLKHFLAMRDLCYHNRWGVIDVLVISGFSIHVLNIIPLLECWPLLEGRWASCPE